MCLSLGIPILFPFLPTQIRFPAQRLGPRSCHICSTTFIHPLRKSFLAHENPEDAKWKRHCPCVEETDSLARSYIHKQRVHWKWNRELLNLPTGTQHTSYSTEILGMWFMHPQNIIERLFCARTLLKVMADHGSFLMGFTVWHNNRDFFFKKLIFFNAR